MWNTWDALSGVDGVALQWDGVLEGRGRGERGGGHWVPYRIVPVVPAEGMRALRVWGDVRRGVVWTAAVWYCRQLGWIGVGVFAVAVVVGVWSAR